jgi:hypothetical protein
MNGYCLIGALQDNWEVYAFTVGYRIVSAGLFLYLGGGWADIAPIEFGCAVALAISMAFSR